MLTNKYIIFRNLLVLFLFLNGYANAQVLSFVELKSAKDWEIAMKDASKSQRFIFLDIYATWCGPCKKMDSEVYSNSAVSEYFNSNFINLKVDGESNFGAVLAGKYSLTAYPSLFFINPEEKLIYGIVGYRGVEDIIEAGKQVNDSGKRYLELDAMYGTPGFLESQTDEYIKLLLKFGKKDELATLAGEKMRLYTNSDILNPANKIFVTAIVNDIESFPVNIVLNNADSLKAAWGMEDLGQYLSTAYDITMRKATEAGDSVLMEKLAKEFIPVYMMDNPDRIPEAQLTTRKIYYSETEEWDYYISEVEKYYKDHEPRNPRFLYQEAYYIIENQINSSILLNKALEWVKQVIEINPAFENYFLAAIINTYRADNDAAALWMQKAESVASSEDEKSSLEELKKYLDAQSH